MLDWPPQDKLQYVIPTLLTTERPFLSQPTGVNIQYRKIKLADIFAFSRERGKNLTVLLSSPGGGKSTLAWFISRGWARGQLYQEYRLLVHVSFRDHPKLLSAARLEDIIPHPDEESKQNVIQLLKQTEGNGVAIIIDGYDEYGSNYLYSNVPSVVDILLQVVPKASLLVTSRPTYPVKRSLLQHSKNITSVWLSEFSREQVAEYFSRNMEDGTEINMHFDENVGLLGLCYTPINASIVLFLLQVCKPTQLPSTQTKLFECVTINLLIRYWEDQRGFEIEGPIKDIKKAPFHWQFKRLCQQIYYAAFGEESIHDMRYEDFLDLPLGGIHDTLGLVSLERLPNGVQQITFMHTLFKDFFVAYYLSTLAIEKQTARVRHLCQHDPESPMLSFIAGLTKLNCEEIFAALANFLTDFPQNSEDYEEYCLAKSFSFLDCDPQDPDHRHSLFTLLKCVYESQRPELCQKIISRVGGMYTRVGGVQKAYLSLSYYAIGRFPQGCNAIGYFLGVIAATSRVNSQLVFSLVGNLLRDAGIQILCEQMVQTYKQLRQPKPANTDIHLYLAVNCITHKGVSVFSQAAQQIPAITGILLGFNWSPHIYTYFEEVMPVVDIERCLKYLVESLASRTSPKKVTINLAGNTLCNKHIWHLLLLLMFSNNLVSLDLSQNCFGKLSVDLIAVALQHCMLKILDLGKCGITSDSLSLLGKRLEFNSTLELLDIRNNLLSQASLMEFFTHLRNNLSLARVWIDDWKDEYAEIFRRINTRRFHQGAMFLGCKVGKQAQTYLVRPNVSSSLLDSSKFSFRQLYPQSLYGPIQFPDRY